MPVLAVPEPLTVHVPAASAWSPTLGGLPMSVHDQPAGHAEGDAGGEGAAPGAPTLIESMVEAEAVPFRPDVANAPTVTASGMTTTAELPGTSVYVRPSGETAGQ